MGGRSVEAGKGGAVTWRGLRGVEKPQRPDNSSAGSKGCSWFYRRGVPFRYFGSSGSEQLGRVTTFSLWDRYIYIKLRLCVICAANVLVATLCHEILCEIIFA